MAPMMTGQMYFMQNQTNTIIAIDWPSNVPMLIATEALSSCSNQRAPQRPLPI
jgi:hypothetical protein